MPDSIKIGNFPGDQNCMLIIHISATAPKFVVENSGKCCFGIFDSIWVWTRTGGHEIMRFVYRIEIIDALKPIVHLFELPCLPLTGLDPIFPLL